MRDGVKLTFCGRIWQSCHFGDAFYPFFFNSHSVDSHFSCEWSCVYLQPWQVTEQVGTAGISKSHYGIAHGIVFNAASWPSGYHSGQADFDDSMVGHLPIISRHAAGYDDVIVSWIFFWAISTPFLNPHIHPFPSEVFFSQLFPLHSSLLHEVIPRTLILRWFHIRQAPPLFSYLKQL